MKRFLLKNSTPEECLKRLSDKYEEKVVRSDGCWDWMGNKNSAGYGRLQYIEKVEGVHRVSWILHYGEIPKGMFVLHKCDYPSCSNPSHLFLGTQKDNVADMVSKQRDNKRKGSAHPRAILNETQVSEIKKLIELGYSQSDIAKNYGVSPGTVGDIKLKKIWKSIPSAVSVSFPGLPKKDKFQKGENNSGCKLSIVKVREIRELLKLGWSLTKISRKYGVSVGAIQGIKCGKNWKDV